MNPRDFCLEHDLPVAILACFNFDPLFFERIVLPALRVGGAERVLVLADAGAVAEALPRWAGQAVNLGRGYLLSLPAATGAFHPKFILRLGARGGTFWAGSGNLSTGGWGMNQEVAAHWTLGPEGDDSGDWLEDFLSALRSWCAGDDLATEFLRQVIERRWWPPASETPPVLLQGPGRASLFDQLRRRWPMRRFEALRFTTGSTDTDGAFLRRAHHEFGVQDAIMAADPARVSLDPAALPATRVRLRVSPQPGMHAKLYWFDGANPAAAIGSANCSASGWFGANTELMLVYDQPDPELFAPLLDVTEAAMPASDVLYAAPQQPQHEDDPLPAPPWRITAASLSPMGVIEVTISPTPDPMTTAVLHVGTSAIVLSGVEGGPGRYFGPAPECVSNAARTIFCTVSLAVNGTTISTPPRWLDDTAALNRTRSGRSLAGSLEGLLEGGDDAEHQRLVNDVRLVTDALFDGTPTFLDPEVTDGSSTRAAREPQQESSAPGLDPADMVVGLWSSDPEAMDLPLPAGRGHDLPLLGVMEVLFGRVARVAEDDETPDDEADNHASPAPSPTPRRVAPPPPLREKLAGQVERFLSRYAEVDEDDRNELRVATRFTASDLVQATAYPLAIAAMGLESGWVDGPTARRWVGRLIDLLFHQIPQGGGVDDAGVLRRARRRFEQQGKVEVFDRVVGDGTLWLTLCSAVAALPRHDLAPHERLDDLLAWRALWSSRELIGGADQSRLRLLLRRLRAEQAKDALRRHGPAAHAALVTLEAWLEEHGAALLKQQARSRPTANPGDLLWGPRPGWAVTRRGMPGPKPKALVHLYRAGREASVQLSGFFVNLQAVAGTTPELADHLQTAGLMTIHGRAGSS